MIIVIAIPYCWQKSKIHNTAWCILSCSSEAWKNLSALTLSSGDVTESLQSVYRTQGSTWKPLNACSHPPQSGLWASSEQRENFNAMHVLPIMGFLRHTKLSRRKDGNTWIGKYYKWLSWCARLSKESVSSPSSPSPFPPCTAGDATWRRSR